MIEAKANLSFSGTVGTFMQGVRYQVDETDLRIRALIAGGYLSPTGVKEDGDDPMDLVRVNPVSRHRVGLGVARSEEEEDGEVNVQGGAEQG